MNPLQLCKLVLCVWLNKGGGKQHKKHREPIMTLGHFKRPLKQPLSLMDLGTIKAKGAHVNIFSVTHLSLECVLRQELCTLT